MKTTNTIGIITACFMTATAASAVLLPYPTPDYDVAGHQAVIESLQEPEPVVLYTPKKLREVRIATKEEKREHLKQLFASAR